MPIEITCFKAYDVRGQIPGQLNTDIAYRIGNATAEFLKAEKVVIGRDIRLSSPEIADAVAKGLRQGGADVIDVGVGGTELVYFATQALGAHGGIMITASHNPADYNGMKFVREDSKPISADTGLADIRRLAEKDERYEPRAWGSRTGHDIWPAYVEKLLSYVDVAALQPFRVVVNAGNGGAGAVIDALEPHLPFEFVKVHHDADGTFPNGVPNPLLPENRDVTIDAIREHDADFAIAWDGDYDRCFLFDENGGFIEGYYIVGLLAISLLAKSPGEKIVHDPRLTWNTIAMVEEAGGVPVQSRSGHAFMKETMRREDAIYGGEMSAHHFFRDFAFSDSGMIPWLLVAEIMSRQGKPLSELVAERIAAFPASGEINREIPDVEKAFAAVRARYEGQANSVDETDGIGFDFDDWRFNLRASNTEPVVRLNVESRGDKALMERKTAEILELLDTL
jgi:phosphomannomutase